MIAPEHVGTYRQQAAKMVIQRTGGAPIESKRPVNADGVFLDGESPTLVTLDASCEIDVPFALSTGARPGPGRGDAARRWQAWLNSPTSPLACTSTNTM